MIFLYEHSLDRIDGEGRKKRRETWDKDSPKNYTGLRR